VEFFLRELWSNRVFGVARFKNRVAGQKRTHQNAQLVTGNDNV